MKHLSRLSDSSLAFHVQDAAAALSAMPLSHKAQQYLFEAQACESELTRRAWIRQTRDSLKRYGRDPLTRQLPRITPDQRRLWPDDCYSDVEPRTRYKSDRAEIRFHLSRLAYLTNSRPA